MKISHYTITVPHYPQKGEHLLFHTRTQALVKVPEELKKIIDENTSASVSDNNLTYREDIKKLQEMGIVVEDEEDDRKKMEQFFQDLKYSIIGKMLPVTFLTTSSCNFKCIYCFEEASRSPKHMDKETADMAMRWLQDRMQKISYETLYMIFYGGEPLLNEKILDYIIPVMHGWCKNHGYKFNFMLQTNGYLLKPHIVDRYLPFGLKEARISLDGVGREHDRKRPLRTGGGTFDRIMENIMANVDRVRIGISMTYDEKRIDHIEHVIDFFAEKGVLHKLGEFIFSPIHPTLGPTSNNKSFCHSQCLDNFADDSFSDTVFRIRELMREKGLPVKSGMAISACSLTRENSGVTIDQEGYLYRCNSMLGYVELSIGHVRDTSFNDKQKEFRDLDVWRACPESCPYLPMCQGGCRLMSYFEHKDFKQPSCKKKFLDAVSKEFIKEKFERRQKEM